MTQIELLIFDYCRLYSGGIYTHHPVENPLEVVIIREFGQGYSASGGGIGRTGS